MEIVIKIKELAKKNNISIRKLGRISKISHSSLCNLANNKRQRIDFEHIKRLSAALNITDIREIIEIRSNDEQNSK
ncbi:helix-turn-helix transcriptional regulator [Neobacillus sp. PS2-9]|uniref:helix-turn-helix domain-containing protein n=1 Tax=Neobacillus sp. PS2-9 TaxID=3070676 RepID=UPI0027DFA042|nr:helix-turn-helix transcriptional regulator [Neobacillus sp. PS2-9]WML56491.1 helix-turn-helix transcriptional regulator [Neobacillus sp. PS2-9]